MLEVMVVNVESWNARQSLLLLLWKRLLQLLTILLLPWPYLLYL